MDVTQQILNFYGWWQLVTCLFAFMGLLAIWYHLGRKKGDFGQVWLALSILCWSISGGIEVYYSNLVAAESALVYLSGWRSIFSLLNSLFILCALPWFRHRPQWLGQLLEGKLWYLIIGLPFLFSFLPTVVLMLTGSSMSLISELDVYYAIFTLILLVFILWESFTKRGLQLLGYLSVIFVLVTLVAQFYKFSEEVQTLILFSAIFKSLLIMIFFALALSWVKDISQSLRLSPADIKLQLTKEKQTTGRFKNIATISGLANTKIHAVQLTNTNYDLLSKFAEVKIENPEAGWLEIKPKSDSRNIDYDIRDHNEIKRLIIALLDGIYGKGSWDKERHEQPLKEALFQFSKDKSRLIRLNIPSINILT